MGPLEPNVPELILGLIVFFALFGVLGKVLLPRIERTLAERHDRTDGGLARAEETRAEAERVRKEFRAELAAARHEAAVIRQTAAEEGAALIAELRAEALQQREQLLAEAHVQLAADRVLAEAALREDVIRVASELASRVVGEPLADLPSTVAIAEEFRSRAEV